MLILMMMNHQNHQTIINQRSVPRKKRKTITLEHIWRHWRYFSGLRVVQWISQICFFEFISEIRQWCANLKFACQWRIFVIGVAGPAALKLRIIGRNWSANIFSGRIIFDHIALTGNKIPRQYRPVYWRRLTGSNCFTTVIKSTDWQALRYSRMINAC